MDSARAAWHSVTVRAAAAPAARGGPPVTELPSAHMHASERASILAELTPPFTLLRPEEQLTPVVFCSPHSGRIYPKAFLEASRLDPHTLRKSEDCYVDELFEPVVALGAPLIAARFPRAYLDVNREPYELDPELFIGRCRISPIPSRRASSAASAPSPAWWPIPRRSIASGCRSAPLRAHRAPVSAVPRGAGRPAGGRRASASAWRS